MIIRSALSTAGRDRAGYTSRMFLTHSESCRINCILSPYVDRIRGAYMVSLDLPLTNSKFMALLCCSMLSQCSDDTGFEVGYLSIVFFFFQFWC